MYLSEEMKLNAHSVEGNQHSLNILAIMAKKITYLFGAGASANSLPVLEGLPKRFDFFCNHFISYLKNKNHKNYIEVENKQKALLENISKHHTIDTYARKLYLKNPFLHTNTEYNFLTNYLSAYFLYEQLEIDLNENCNNFLRDSLFPVYTDTYSEITDIAKSIINTLDRRYDSFLANILGHNEEKKISMPSNLNFISWNYDMQFEKAYMDYQDCSLSEAINLLNVVGTRFSLKKTSAISHLIKLNGTADFYDTKYLDRLFDFSTHHLNNETFNLFEDILTKDRSILKNCLRFAWEKGEYNSQEALDLAKEKIENSDAIVIIGYSFPNFNREIDSLLFSSIKEKDKVKIYIQAPEKDLETIIKRFKGLLSDVRIEGYSNTTQFLIPDEWYG